MILSLRKKQSKTFPTQLETEQGITTRNPHTICEIIKKFFVNIGKKLANLVPQASNLSFFQHQKILKTLFTFIQRYPKKWRALFGA